MNIQLNHNGQQMGTFTREQVEGMIRSGAITYETLGRTETVWRPVRDLILVGTQPPRCETSVSASPIHLNHNGHALGSFSREQVEAMLRSGAISYQTLAWTNNQTDCAQPLHELIGTPVPPPVQSPIQAQAVGDRSGGPSKRLIASPPEKPSPDSAVRTASKTQVFLKVLLAWVCGGVAFGVIGSYLRSYNPGSQISDAVAGSVGGLFFGLFWGLLHGLSIALGDISGALKNRRTWMVGAGLLAAVLIVSQIKSWTLGNPIKESGSGSTLANPIEEKVSGLTRSETIVEGYELVPTGKSVALEARKPDAAAAAATEKGYAAYRLAIHNTWLKLLSKNDPQLHSAVRAAIAMSGHSGKKAFVMCYSPEDGPARALVSDFHGGEDNVLTISSAGTLFKFDKDSAAKVSWNEALVTVHAELNLGPTRVVK